MDSILKSIDYKNVFKYFEEISDVPRGSKDNEKISDYLVSFAQKNKLKYIQDESYNVVIFKEASKGYEDVENVIIQAHMDMVCEKNDDIEHDFLTQGLELEIVDGYIHAKGTTLGADDGIGVAYALAVLADKSLKHPSLTIVITTDEEIGMCGAANIDPKYLKGKYMLNVDQEEEGIILSSCAGGLDVKCIVPLDYEEDKGVLFELYIYGLKGGHSGTEIGKYRLNADKVMIRILKMLNDEKCIKLVSLYGGKKDNVIPNEAIANVIVKKENCLKFINVLCNCYRMLKQEYVSSEPDMKVSIKQESINSGQRIELSTIDNEEKYFKNKLNEVMCDTMTEKSIIKVISCITLMPDGVQKMSPVISGLVESSLNLGVLEVNKEKGLQTEHLIRSSVNSFKEYIYDKLEALCIMFGGKVERGMGYLAWEYKKDSYLRELSNDIYTDMFGKKPKIEAIHAGLECGVLSSKNEDLDIISFGPEIKDIHTTRERLDIASTVRMYDFLVKILEQIQK